MTDTQPPPTCPPPQTVPAGGCSGFDTITMGNSQYLSPQMPTDLSPGMKNAFGINIVGIRDSLNQIPQMLTDYNNNGMKLPTSVSDPLESLATSVNKISTSMGNTPTQVSSKCDNTCIALSAQAVALFIIAILFLVFIIRSK